MSVVEVGVSESDGTLADSGSKGTISIGILYIC